MSGRVLWVAALGGLLLGSAPFALAEVWTPLSLSGSPTVPEEGEGSPFVGEKDLYLYVGASFDAVEFGFVGTLEVVSVAPGPGYENVGTTLSPIIVPTVDCGDTGGYVAVVAVRDATGAGGRVCLSLSQQSARSCFIPCDAPDWYRFSGVFGYRTDGGLPCDQAPTDCLPLAVGSTSWGEAKARYR